MEDRDLLFMEKTMAWPDSPQSSASDSSSVKQTAISTADEGQSDLSATSSNGRNDLHERSTQVFIFKMCLH